MIRFIAPIIFVALVFGQGTAGTPTDVKLGISATVVDYIEIITLSDITVGTVQPSQVEIRLDPRLDQGAGIIKVQGRAESSIRIAYTQQVEMVNSVTNHMLTVTYNLSGNAENEQSTSVPIMENPITVDMSTTGEYYIWIGCYFNLLGITPGNYDGDFVIEVDYN